MSGRPAFQPPLRPAQLISVRTWKHYLGVGKESTSTGPHTQLIDQHFRHSMSLKLAFPLPPRDPY